MGYAEKIWNQEEMASDESAFLYENRTDFRICQYSKFENLVMLCGIGRMPFAGMKKPSDHYRSDGFV